MHSIKIKNKVITKFFQYLFLCFVALFVIVPFIWVFSNAFRFNSEIGQFVNFSLYTFIPKEFTLDNFERMFEQLPMFNILMNTVFVAATVTVGSLLLNSLAGYAFAKIEFVGRKAVFYLMLSMLVLPIEILIIPLYLLTVQMKIFDTYWALIVPFLASPFGIFYMRQFFSGIHKSLDEAALLDGCGHFKRFIKIYLPLAKTPLFTLGLLIFLQQWDSFIVPVTLINDETKMLLQVALTRLSMGLYATDYGVLYAGVTISIIPIMIIYLIFQKNIVENIASVGIKG